MKSLGRKELQDKTETFLEQNEGFLQQTGPSTTPESSTSKFNHNLDYRLIYSDIPTLFLTKTICVVKTRLTSSRIK